MQKTVSQELYKNTKEKAYTLASELSKEEIIRILKNDHFSNEEEEIIYKTTLMFPNDMEILEIYSDRTNVTSKKNYHNLAQTSSILGIPKEILQVKILEYNKYNLAELLAENVNLRRLAEQASQFEATIDKNVK